MSIKVLVVDDARAIRSSIKDFFDKNFFEVVGDAADGFEALKEYERLKPDIVTMDMNMPDCDGVKAIKMIKEIDPDAYIIIISSMDEDIIEGLEAGARACIFKPISMIKFREVIGRAVVDVGNRKENPERYCKGKTQKKWDKEDEVNKMRITSKYVSGVSHGDQITNWDEDIVYKIYWSDGKMILEIRKDPPESAFNELIKKMEFLKEKNIGTEILCGEQLGENMKIDFLKMVLSQP